MKFSLPGLAAIALIALASPAHAGLTFNFQDNGSNIALSSPSHTFFAKVGSTYDSAYGITTTGTADLYVKNRGGDEVGLGLVNDPSGDHEITSCNYINFDFTALKSEYGIATIDINLESVTPPDAYGIFGVSSNGVATLLGTGTSDGAFLISAANVAAYNVFEVEGLDGNVLVGSITINGIVPEPASLAMTVLGLGSVLVAYGVRRRKGAKT